MPFENFTPFTKDKITPVGEPKKAAEIIPSILNKTNDKGIKPTEVLKQPYELDRGQPRHKIYDVNSPRHLEIPGHKPNFSADSAVHPKPPETL